MLFLKKLHSSNFANKKGERNRNCIRSMSTYVGSDLSSFFCCGDAEYVGENRPRAHNTYFDVRSHFFRPQAIEVSLKNIEILIMVTYITCEHNF